MIAAVALAAACFNETQLFCKGKSGGALSECLAEYSANATPECQSALGDRKPKGKSEPVWGSAGKASGPSVDALTFSASVSEEAPADGFEVAVEDAPADYPAAGSTPAAILGSMGRSGIVDGIDGGKGAASTGGDLSAKYSRKKDADGCRLSAAKLTMKVTQRLPKWDETADASPETKAWWAKELGVIKLHEDGHKKIDVDSARAALGYLQRLGAYSTCEDLDGAVASELHRANLEGMQQNVAYDAETRHGRTQFEAAFGKP